MGKHQTKIVIPSKGEEACWSVFMKVKEIFSYNSGFRPDRFAKPVRFMDVVQVE